MEGLDSPSSTYGERVRRTQLGPSFYQEWKEGGIEEARPRNFTLYFWNTRATRTSQMSAYVLGTEGGVRRNSVEEIQPNFGAVFDPAHNLGQPERAFRLQAEAGASFQVPWNMIGEETYILICSGDDQGVFPNRRTANEGFWFTPEYLSYAKMAGWEWILASPFLSLR